MQVLKDGEEVKGATVVYYSNGAPAHVSVDGINYDPKAFELKDDEPVKKTTAVSGALENKDEAKVIPVKDEDAKTEVETTESDQSGAMTTEDVKH